MNDINNYKYSFRLNKKEFDKFSELSKESGSSVPYMIRNLICRALYVWDEDKKEKYKCHCKKK